MSLNIGDIAPNFTADTTHGMINFYEWMNESWTVFLSHPKDFTPVCTTELIWLSNNLSEFVKRNIKIISLSVDKLIHHSKWLDDIKERFNTSINIPIIADKNMRIAKLYNMLYVDDSVDSVDSDKNIKTLKKDKNNYSTIRSVYIISPGKKIYSVLNYPRNTGRNFNEILRLMDSLIITRSNNVATPANWQLGDKPIIPQRDVSKEEILGYPKEVNIETRNYFDDAIDFDILTTNDVAI